MYISITSGRNNAPKTFIAKYCFLVKVQFLILNFNEFKF